jgi:hypothetical protein
LNSGNCKPQCGVDAIAHRYAPVGTISADSSAVRSRLNVLFINHLCRITFPEK